MILFKRLFQAKQGSLPYFLYVLPILPWAIWAFFSFNKSVTVTTSTKLATSLSKNLQADINFIASKNEQNDFFDMSKEELLKASKNDNFLLNKVKRRLERSDYAKSMGTKDDVPILFDEALNATVDKNVIGQLGVQENLPIKEISTPQLSSKVDSATAMQQVKSALARATGSPTNYDYLEAERKQRLAAAKEDNRNRRLALDQSTLDEEAAAYRRGLEDHDQMMAAINGEPNYYQDKKDRRTKSVQRKNRKLTFDTQTGIKDDLNRYKDNRRERKNEDETNARFPLSKLRSNPQQEQLIDKAPLTTQELASNPKNKPLYATIDNAQKVKNGSKVRLRIIEAGVYKGYLLKANQIVYGMASVNNGRIQIRVSAINIDGDLLAAGLQVYDLDGMQGIYIEGSKLNIGNEAIRTGIQEAGRLGLRNNLLGNFSLRLGNKANRRQTTAAISSGYDVILFDRALNY